MEGDDQDAVPYPTPQASEAPLAFPWELPDPIPAGATRPAGFPITLQFPMGGPEATIAAAQLTDAQGRIVPIHLSTPQKPATDFPQMNTVCLIPKRPLQPGTRYRVQVTGRLAGADFDRTWTFSTRAPERPNKTTIPRAAQNPAARHS